MIPDGENTNVGRQELIDLLCRITNTDDEIPITNNDEQEVTIIDDNSTVEEGEIIAIDDDDDDDNDKRELEDGELNESPESDV